MRATTGYTARKEETPTGLNIFQSVTEIRAELPSTPFDNLVYMGKLDYATWHVTPHYHDHYEICYVEEGNGWFAIGDYFYEVKKGDLFLTKPGEVHQGAASGDCEYRLYYFGFHLAQLGSLAHPFAMIGETRVVPDPSGKIRLLCDLILAETVQIGIGFSREMIQGLMQQTLVMLLRIFEQAMRTDNDGPVMLPAAIQHVLHVLAEAEKLPNMTSLAGEVKMSRSHLDREFKRYMGVPIGRYIRLLWMDKARALLRDEQITVTEIADKLGFESIHAFSLFFKRQQQCSPSMYREGLKNDEKI